MHISSPHHQSDHSHSDPQRPYNRDSYNEQQVLLFWLLSKILRRLARSITWAELDTQDKRRLAATLKTLESDVHLVRLITSSQIAGSAKLTEPRSQARRKKSTKYTGQTTKAASAEEVSSSRIGGLPRPSAPRNGTVRQ